MFAIKLFSFRIHFLVNLSTNSVNCIEITQKMLIWRVPKCSLEPEKKSQHYFDSNKNIQSRYSGFVHVSL
jgi:hypothetical protein